MHKAYENEKNIHCERGTSCHAQRTYRTVENEDFSREVRAVTDYVASSKLLAAADDAPLAASLKSYADAELSHALTLAAQIDSLGGMPEITPLVGMEGDNADETLERDLSYEMLSIWNYSVRVKQCEELGEHTLADFIRKILAQDLEHFSRLTHGLGNYSKRMAEPSNSLSAATDC